MESQEIRDQLDAVEERLQNEDGITILHANNQPFTGFIFEDMALIEFAEQGLELGATDFYLFEDQNKEGELILGGLCFFHHERPHSIYIENEEGTSTEEPEPAAGRHASGFGFDRQESEEEKQRKQEIAAELLSGYSDYLEEDEQFRIDNRLDHMRLREILRIKERVEQESSIDPELEKELAHTVYESEQFNQQFNETDTEMLLDQLDVEFNLDKIRVEEVHTRAKSLIKINQ